MQFNCTIQQPSAVQDKKATKPILCRRGKMGFYLDRPPENNAYKFRSYSTENFYDLWGIDFYGMFGVKVIRFSFDFLKGGAQGLRS